MRGVLLLVRTLVVGFASDPNYRGFMDSVNVLFINAVFRGPAYTHRLR